MKGSHSKIKEVEKEGKNKGGGGKAVIRKYGTTVSPHTSQHYPEQKVGFSYHTLYYSAQDYRDFVCLCIHSVLDLISRK